ncbi:MAG: hypothetical protein DRO76_05690 [Candidatus Altiarchaeales archaeon]|nr:MAG: hypothetical protein DRO76_05690 [Candidatus Altiarchaeales archaeon]
MISACVDGYLFMTTGILISDMKIANMLSAMVISMRFKMLLMENLLFHQLLYVYLHIIICLERLKTDKYK